MTHRAFFERWFSELWEKRDPDIIEECVADDCIRHGLPDTGHGRVAFRTFFHAFSGAFPRIELHVDECLEAGESFAVRCSGKVTDHAGKTHPFSGGVMGKVRNGRIVEAWNQWDLLGLLESMGAIERELFTGVLVREQAKAER